VARISSLCRRYREQLGRFDVQAALYLSSARGAPPAFHPLLRRIFVSYWRDLDNSEMAQVADRVARAHGWSVIEMVAPGTQVLDTMTHLEPGTLRRILREGREETVFDEAEDAQAKAAQSGILTEVQEAQERAEHSTLVYGECTVEPSTHEDIVDAKDQPQAVLGDLFKPPPGLFP